MVGVFSLFFLNDPIEAENDDRIISYENRTIGSECSYSYNNTLPLGCLVENIDYKPDNPTDPRIYYSTKVKPSVVFNKYDNNMFSKSLVKSESIPRNAYDNVGEPSFASNGNITFYTGNHYAAAKIDNGNWQFVDPSYDFLGYDSDPRQNFSIFWADQRTVYDHEHDLFIWIRQGDITSSSSKIENVDRLAISRDTINWIVYDLKATAIFNPGVAGDTYFDYPDLVIGNQYLYLTTSIKHCFGAPQTCGLYGAIIRFALDDFESVIEDPSNSRIKYDAILDKSVTSIAAVDHSTNPMYFGAHVPWDSRTPNDLKIKIYQWYTNSSTIDKDNITQVKIDKWNPIQNDVYCSDFLFWWCAADTNDKIRSAWMYNNTINFLWNSVTTYDNGRSWIPYIDVATFNVSDLKYSHKYYVTQKSVPWIFGAASPNSKGQLGIIAYYVDNNITNSDIYPYLNLAFGIFNEDKQKWEMVPIINSTASLPVINPINNNKDLKKEYNFGDFITIRKSVNSSSENFMFDIGAYVISGNSSKDISPYFIKAK